MPVHVDHRKWEQIIHSCKTIPAIAKVHSALLHHLDQHVFLSNLLLHAYSRTGAVHLARQIFDATRIKNLFTWALMLSAYAQQGHIQDALQIFHAMPERDVVSWTTLASAYANLGHLEQAQELFDEMPAWDITSWNALLQGYASSRRIDQAVLVFDRLSCKNLVSFNTMLAAYARSGHVEKATQVFEHMPLRDLVSWTTYIVMILQRDDEIDMAALEALCVMIPEWDAVAKNALFSWLAQNGQLERARLEFSSMEETNLVTFNTMLAALLQLSGIDAALDFLTARMPEHNLFSWNTLLAAYAQNGDVQKSIAVFDSMNELDIVSWNSLLHAFAQSSRLEEAKQVFDEMPQRNIASWTTLLVSYAQHGQIDQAASLFTSMNELDFVSWTAMLVVYAQHGLLLETKLVFFQMPEWNQISWNALLAAHAHHASQLAAGEKIFARMPSLDLVSWTSMLGAYAQSGKTTSVLQLFHSMTAAAERPDETCFVRVLHACNHSGGLYAAWSCFVSLSLDYGVSPGKQHFCCMVDVLGRSSRLDDAEDLIHTMPFVADALEWMCLLSACRSYRDEERAARAVEWIIRARPQHSATYILLANDKLDAF